MSRIKETRIYIIGGTGGMGKWLADFLGVTPSAVNLAESTGLNVKMPAAEEPKQPFVERSQRRSRDSDASKPTSEG